MKDFRELKVWQKAHELTLGVYRTTKAFPREEQFGLTAQLRRAAESVAANIAEGCGRDGDPEFARFLQIAMGSASETEYHLLLARDLGLLHTTDYDPLAREVEEVKKMLTALIRKLRADRRKLKADG
jgi:four helix bundle protein